MSNFSKLNEIELNEIELNEINGGGILTTIATIGGIIAGANEIYKFGAGFIEGYTSN